MFSRKDLVVKAIQAAGIVRKKLKIDAVSTIDPVEIAEKLGCTVFFQDIDALEGMYSKEPRPVIVIGSHRPNGRKNFTCAHELGHHYFNHGTKVDQLANTYEQSKNAEEFLVDCFAGFLLMPKRAVLNAISKRNFDIYNITAIELYILASAFGTGYGTMLNHLTYSLNMISKAKFNELKKYSPKEIKKDIGIETSSDIVMVDSNWLGRPIDLQMGDIIACPKNYEVKDSLFKIYENAASDIYSFYEAINAGYSRIHDNKEWAVNIRIARKEYSGLAKYRFLTDED